MPKQKKKEETKKSNAGRKGKYKEWLLPERLMLIQGWARDGLLDEHIAKNMGIHIATFYEWKNRFPEFSEALKFNKEMADYIVENALFTAARKGNIAAIIFWLKNRQKKKYKENPIDDDIREVNDNRISLADVIRNPVPDRQLPNDT